MCQADAVARPLKTPRREPLTGPAALYREPPPMLASYDNQRPGKRRPSDPRVVRVGDQLVAIRCNTPIRIFRQAGGWPWMIADASVARPGEMVQTIDGRLFGRVAM